MKVGILNSSHNFNLNLNFSPSFNLSFSLGIGLGQGCRAKDLRSGLGQARPSASEFSSGSSSRTGDALINLVKLPISKSQLFHSIGFFFWWRGWG
jgi:hypothetical protein